MGNILNRSNATAFRIEVLEKLSGVRDTVNRKSLLHHVVSRCTRTSLVGELITIFWLGSEKVPGVAAQPWQLVAGAEGPRPGRPHWLWGASDQPQQNGGASLRILNYFDKHKVECRSSLGYLHLSHSYCSATRALITSFLEVLPNLQMFPHISHFIFTKPPHAPKRFTFKTSHMQINCLSAFIVFLIHATLAHWHICTGSSQGFAIYQGGNSTRRGVWIF